MSCCDRMDHTLHFEKIRDQLLAGDIGTAFRNTRPHDVKLKDESGMTLLHYCSYKENCGLIVMALVARGANVDSQCELGNTPLMEACLRRKFSMARALIACGADVNIQNKVGETALSAACDSGHAGIICLLSEQGADPDMRDNVGLKPADYYKGQSVRVKRALRVHP
jgi:ankyrin repeat protein